MSEKENRSNLPLTAEQLRALDPDFWTDEKIKHQMDLWSYQAPSDPNELLAHARNATAYEAAMRSLNYDLHTGNITYERYQILAKQTTEQRGGIK